MAESLSDFEARVSAFMRAQRAQDAWMRSVARKVGDDAKKIAERSARTDVGADLKFSGWAPLLETRYRIVDDGRTVVFTPTRLSAGPWTVADVGRNQGNASGFAGPGVNRSTGETARTKSGNVRKVRATQGRRWNGRTRGFGTAGRVTRTINVSAPRIVDAEMNALIRRTF